MTFDFRRQRVQFLSTHLGNQSQRKMPLGACHLLSEFDLTILLCRKAIGALRFAALRKVYIAMYIVTIIGCN